MWAERVKHVITAMGFAKSDEIADKMDVRGEDLRRIKFQPHLLSYDVGSDFTTDKKQTLGRSFCF